MRVYRVCIVLCDIFIVTESMLDDWQGEHYTILKVATLKNDSGQLLSKLASWFQKFIYSLHQTIAK